MLSTKEKTLFSSLLALFVVPELIWGMVTKFWFYSIFGVWKQVNEHVSFLFDQNNARSYFLILVAQIISLVFLFVIILKKRQQIRHYILISISLFVAIVFTAYVVLSSYFVAFGSITLSGM